MLFRESSTACPLVNGEFMMWYRICDNQERGRGYGFARSKDGLNWEKYENNPLFTHDPAYSSNEKISVLKVDGLFRAWYAGRFEYIKEIVINKSYSK